MEKLKSGYVALLGAPNVGKSTLMNRFLKEKVSITGPRPQTTRTRVLGILTRPEFQIVFLDTPGIHLARDYFNKMLVQTALGTLQEVDVICFLIEAPQAYHELNGFVLERLAGIEKPILLVINKIDLVRKVELLPIIDHYRGLRDFQAIVPVSALQGEGVDGLLREVVEVLPEGPRYYPEDYVTDQPERVLVGELIREKVFRLTHEEVPYAVAVTIEAFQEVPEKNLIRIEATIHVERDSQKGIIIGRNGQMLKQIGMQARREIEQLLACQIYLGLFVKVQPNWRKDPRALSRFGYRSER